MKRTITIYTCDICNKESEWKDPWQWFGTIENVQGVVCSNECMHKYIEEKCKKQKKKK